MLLPCDFDARLPWYRFLNLVGENLVAVRYAATASTIIKCAIAFAHACFAAIRRAGAYMQWAVPVVSVDP
jgi:hypothetical protein